MKNPFFLNVSAIREAPGSSLEFRCSGSLDGLLVSGSAVPAGAEVTISGDAQSLEGPRIVIVGTVEAPWEGECRRCLGVARGGIRQRAHEIFEPEPVEGETYQLQGSLVDLTDLVREAVLLELPEAPLCRDDCKGLCPECGVNHNETDCDCVISVGDPRWAALDVLKDPPPS